MRRFSLAIDRALTATWTWPVVGGIHQAYQRRQYDRYYRKAGYEAAQLIPTHRRDLRKLTDDQLHRMIAGDVATDAERITLDREMKRRDAWAAPAGRAFWVSLAAMGIAAASLAVAILRKMRRRLALRISCVAGT